MYPFTSALKETPSSTGESTPTSATVGTAVLGQMVLLASALAAHANTVTTPANASLTYCKLFGLNKIEGSNPSTQLSAQRNPHFAALNNTDRPGVRTGN